MSDSHNMKAASPMRVRAAAPEISTSVRERQPTKAFVSSVVRAAGRTSLRMEQPLKAWGSIVSRPAGSMSWQWEVLLKVSPMGRFLTWVRKSRPMNALASTRSSGMRKCGQATQAPKVTQCVRQRCTAASSAARNRPNSPCAAARQNALAAAKLARLGGSSFSAISMINSSGRDTIAPGS